jgi:hypothetical protein
VKLAITLGLPLATSETGYHNRIQLIWVAAYKDSEGDETANQLVRLGSEQACPIGLSWTGQSEITRNTVGA